MAQRRKSVIDVREIVRRTRLGETRRTIAHALGTSRNTIAKYLAIAVEEGWLESSALPDPATMAARIEEKSGSVEPSGPPSIVEPHREFVLEKRKEGVEIRALHQLLIERGFNGSYSSLRRFVRRHDPVDPEVFLRIETASPQRTLYERVGRLEKTVGLK
ncbi:MAG: hypothetical protein COU08_04005 [Candidatus Harrisonbacteria bacterium CG10_big_fil_rev_8_21_14_0_10_42_17]|uniref:IS21 family transposase n=1 Tax=Candidatus Harrisonbacteria bacterium CG10_big_fil_rev_8_21_14_0_10_42_17 TaxID=1974584 RepID=A0A2M6WH82_9BACT|nr:MAG: hypothetical protein COU08_04005 [Candidatus Harrisonbacteria bacterium CG10_big_fil_rev_8_21_14_0_10_42_17]